nr:hypothetical transcript [Hymenolepis microstoma]
MVNSMNSEMTSLCVALRILPRPKNNFIDSQDEAVHECLDGFNCSIFAYGMTGTGKTYTIFGTKSSPGLVMQCCKALFDYDIGKVPTETSFEVSFYEIYNEHVYDLLAYFSDQENQEKSSLRVREHPRNGPYVENLTLHAISNSDEVQQLIDLGIASRTTAETLANPKSSRGHSVFTIYINQNIQGVSGAATLQSKLHLIDLAGSEKIHNLPSRCYLSETKNINKSLCTLSIVIRRLAEIVKEEEQSARYSSMSTPVGLNHLASHFKKKQKCYVPYRDSKLTWLLRDSLGGNSKTTVIVTVSPSELCLHETIHSLRFAQQIKIIKTHPVNNKESSGRYIDQLLEELNHLRGKMKGYSKVNSNLRDTRMQAYRQKELQASYEDIMRHSADNLNRRQKNKHRKRVQRGTQCLFDSLPEGNKQSELLVTTSHRPTVQDRICQYETFNGLDYEATYYSSKQTLNQACRTSQLACEIINSENTSSSLISEVSDLNDPLDFSSRSLPNLTKPHLALQLCPSRWKSALSWREFYDYSKINQSLESSDQIISTDSLDNILSSAVKQTDKISQRFDYTLTNELFVPEFIPLPTIKSPVAISSSEVEKLCREERNLAKSVSLVDLFNGRSYLQDRERSSYYHINQSKEEGLVKQQEVEFVGAKSDGEQDALTLVTSLGSSPTAFAPKEDEIVIPM